ncbi:MAG: contact-dependent growth inhibition system immunity protein [Coriobacteriia bacterium]|nr:contact-dependent growth inhibition system immunity protein [Coriobacteriia bacterium]MCL2749901.1 contact-dependent growth inhibition system immunity protein [Coriobacteriia bacterium]
MNEKKTLRQTYGLDDDESRFGSSLITWYNNVIDKNEEELNAADVQRMLRQDILREVAIERAIDLFLANPRDGGMWDGDLLSTLVTCGHDFADCPQKNSLISVINELENETSDFDWCLEDDRELFRKNLEALKRHLD